MRELFRLETAATREAVPLVHGLLGAQLRFLGLDGRRSMRLELATEEAALNVIQHAYEGQPGPLIVTATLEGADLVVGIEDRGLPRDPFQPLAFSTGQPEAAGLGSKLMQAMADGVRYRALGRGGKRVDLLIRLPGGPEPAEPPPAESTPRPSVAGGGLEARLFRPEDAGQISQCAYRCYDYSYISDHLYMPDRLIEMNASGELLSAVVVDDAQQVYGHMGMAFSPGSRVPESGHAFVVPEARGGGAFGRMKQLLIQTLRERGVLGYWSEATCAHPASQRTNLDLGIVECGFLPGVIPPQLKMRAIGEQTTQRMALMLFYGSLEDAPLSRVHLPRHHRAWMAGIYEALGFQLEILPSAEPPPDHPSQLAVILRPDLGLGWLRAEKCGADLGAVIRREQVRLFESGAKALILDLPLDAPVVATQTAGLEVDGWLPCGILPRLFPETDAFRMVCLDHVRMNPAILHTASDWGAGLKEYVLRHLPPEYLVDSPEGVSA